MTEETVAPVKSALRQMRTTLEKIESTSISAYFETPKKILKAQFAELYSIIADGESRVDAVIAEDTRIRNEKTTERLNNYITSKVKGMDLEDDAVEYIFLHKSFYNKTAKDAETLDNIDQQLVYLEKNFAAFSRATKKINKLAQEVGPAFNKERFLYSLSKYGDNNDTIATDAEEEADRLKEAVPEVVCTTAVPVKSKAVEEVEEVVLAVSFPVYDKKKSKGSDDVVLSFTIPKEAKKQFSALLKELKGVGIRSKKL